MALNSSGIAAWSELTIKIVHILCIYFKQFVVEVQKKRKFSHNCFGVFGAIKSKFSEVDLSLEPVVDFMIEHVSKSSG